MIVCVTGFDCVCNGVVIIELEIGEFRIQILQCEFSEQ